MFGFGGGKFYEERPINKGFNYVYNIVITSLCFSLFNLPWIVASLILSFQIETALFYLAAAFSAGPAFVSAMYTITKIKRKESFNKLKVFFMGYKHNFFCSLKIWLPYLLFLALLIANIRVVWLSFENAALLLLFVFIGVFVTIGIIYALIFIAKFELTSIKAIKLGIFYSLRKVLRSFLFAFVIFVFFVIDRSNMLITIAIGWGLLVVISDKIASPFVKEIMFRSNLQEPTLPADEELMPLDIELQAQDSEEKNYPRS